VKLSSDITLPVQQRPVAPAAESSAVPVRKARRVETILFALTTSP
jgi:hypothetical protein